MDPFLLAHYLAKSAERAWIRRVQHVWPKKGPQQRPTCQKMSQNSTVWIDPACMVSTRTQDYVEPYVQGSRAVPQRSLGAEPWSRFCPLPPWSRRLFYTVKTSSHKNDSDISLWSNTVGKKLHMRPNVGPAVAGPATVARCPCHFIRARIWEVNQTRLRSLPWGSAVVLSGACRTGLRCTDDHTDRSFQRRRHRARCSETVHTAFRRRRCPTPTRRLQATTQRTSSELESSEISLSCTRLT